MFAEHGTVKRVQVPTDRETVRLRGFAFVEMETDAMPTLDELWHKYLRRFALEHWYRFAKQRLYWTHPQLSSTQAAERWSDLILDFRFWILD